MKSILVQPFNDPFSLQIPYDSSELGKPSHLALLATTVNKIGNPSPRIAGRRQVLMTSSPAQPVAIESVRHRSAVPQHTSLLTPPTTPRQRSGVPSTSHFSVAPQPAKVSNTPSPLHRVAPLPIDYPMYHPLPIPYSPYSVGVGLPAVQSVVPSMSLDVPVCCGLQYPLYHDMYHMNQAMLPQLPAMSPFLGVYPHHDLPLARLPSSLKASSVRRRPHHLIVKRLRRQIGEIIDVVSL